MAAKSFDKLQDSSTDQFQNITTKWHLYTMCAFLFPGRINVHIFYPAQSYHSLNTLYHAT